MGLLMIRYGMIVLVCLACTLAAAQDVDEPPAGEQQQEAPMAEELSDEDPQALEQAPAQDPEAAGDEQDPVDEPRRRGVRRLGDAVGDGSEEWRIDIPSLRAPAPSVAQPQISLPDAEQDARLQSLLTQRAFAPDDPDVQAALDALLDEVAADADRALAAGDTNAARQLVSVIAALDETRPVAARVRAEADRRDRISDLLAQARQAFERGWLIMPEGASARDLYRQVLALDENSGAAISGLADVRQALLQSALEAAQELDFEGAESMIEAAAELDDSPDLIAETRAGIHEYRNRRIEEIGRDVVAAIEDERFDEAEDGITQLVALDESRQRIETLRATLANARLYGGFEPGQVFLDPLEGLIIDGPQMVVVPAGAFMMGSPDNERGRSSNEGPRYRVTFYRGFALARTEISVGDFRIFIDDTGYVTDAERQGWSRAYNSTTGRIDRRNRISWRSDYLGGRADNDLPVIHVSFNDAQAYAMWLARRTGQPYRLPSEAEFEYALRAGSQTRYWWGDGTPAEPVENLTGDGDVSPARSRWTVAFEDYTDGYWGPSPVGHFQPNPFGLYDMGGNVMEWVEDCWHDSYVRAPADGTAWVNPGCERRVVRGGAWSNSPEMCRSAFRLSDAPSNRDARVGFRVARDL